MDRGTTQPIEVVGRPGIWLNASRGVAPRVMLRRVGVSIFTLTLGCSGREQSSKARDEARTPSHSMAPKPAESPAEKTAEPPVGERPETPADERPQLEIAVQSSVEPTLHGILGGDVVIEQDLVFHRLRPDGSVDATTLDARGLVSSVMWTVHGVAGRWDDLHVSIQERYANSTGPVQVHRRRGERWKRAATGRAYVWSHEPRSGAAWVVANRPFVDEDVPPWDRTWPGHRSTLSKMAGTPAPPKLPDGAIKAAAATATGDLLVVHGTNLLRIAIDGTTETFPLPALDPATPVGLVSGERVSFVFGPTDATPLTYDVPSPKTSPYLARFDGEQAQTEDPPAPRGIPELALAPGDVAWALDHDRQLWSHRSEGGWTAHGLVVDGHSYAPHQVIGGADGGIWIVARGGPGDKHWAVLGPGPYPSPTAIDSEPR